jgi:hypothetical protein
MLDVTKISLHCCNVVSFFLAVMLCITKYTIMALLTDNLVDNN